MSFFHSRLKTTSNELSLESSELNEFPAYIVETLPLPRLNVTFYAQIVLKEVSMKPHEIPPNRRVLAACLREKGKKFRTVTRSALSSQ